MPRLFFHVLIVWLWAPLRRCRQGWKILVRLTLYPSPFHLFSEVLIVWQLDIVLSTPLPPALMTRPEDLHGAPLSLGSLALCLPLIHAAFFAPRAWRLHNWTTSSSSWRCPQQLTSEPSIHLDVNLALSFVRVGGPGLLLDLINQGFLGLWTYPQTD